MHQLVTGPLFGDLTEEVLDMYLLKKFYRIRANMDYTYKEYADHMEIIECTGLRKHEEIPEYIHDKPVTKVRSKRK